MLHTKKIIALLFIVILFPVNYTFAQTESKAYPHENLGNRLKRIGETYGKTIAFDTEQTKTIQVEALKAQSFTIEQALIASLSTTSFTYKKTSVNSYVIIKKQAPAENPKPRGSGRLSGLVTDEKGEPVIGATVRIAGTELATITNMDGNYSLQAPAGETTIEVSFISYQKKKVTGIDIKPDRTTKLDLTLSEASRQLTEVTITANMQRSSAAGLLSRQ